MINLIEQVNDDLFPIAVSVTKTKLDAISDKNSFLTIVQVYSDTWDLSLDTPVTETKTMYCDAGMWQELHKFLSSHGWVLQDDKPYFEFYESPDFNERLDLRIARKYQ